MKVINVGAQGSKEWHEHRAKYRNASDAPAMYGCSKYLKRDALLQQHATGVSPEFSEWVQEHILDRGHRFEALARPLAEKIVGEDLSPLIGLNGEYSSSFDGVTFAQTINWEHKSLNDSIRKAADVDDLPLEHRVQMEHQLITNDDAEKTLFMATAWNDDDTLAEEPVWFWYKSDPKLRKEIMERWDQFEQDCEEWEPIESKPEVVGEAMSADLPLPTVIAKGTLVESNLDTILPRFDAYLDDVNTELATDQDFADAAENAKQCRGMAKKLRGVAEAVVAQMVSVSEVQSKLKQYESKMDAMGLQLEKLVKAEKESIKCNAIMVAQDYYNEHVTLINNDLKTVEIPRIMPDFAGAIKGVRTVSSMQSRINDALAAGKAEATTTATDYKTKLAYITDAIADYEHLFNLQSLVANDIDHIKLRIDSEIREEKERVAAAVRKKQQDGHLHQLRVYLEGIKDLDETELQATSKKVEEYKAIDFGEQKATADDLIGDITAAIKARYANLSNTTSAPAPQADLPVSKNATTNAAEKTDIPPADKADPSTWVFSDAQAIAFMSTLCRNIDDKKLSDTDFRQIIRMSLANMVEAA